jgi:hypothetical protein
MHKIRQFETPTDWHACALESARADMSHKVMLRQHTRLDRPLAVCKLSTELGKKTGNKRCLQEHSKRQTPDVILSLIVTLTSEKNKILVHF